MRDAAYESLPKRLRAELHAEIAELLAAGDDELVGHHLEQAYVYRRELGLLDERDEELAERGADRLAAAGRRARRRRYSGGGLVADASGGALR